MKTVQDYKKAITRICLLESHQTIPQIDQNNKQELYMTSALLASYALTPHASQVPKQNRVSPQLLKTMIKKTAKE